MSVVELILALVAIAGTVVAAIRLRSAALELEATRLATVRLASMAEERARRAERAREIAEVVGNTSSAVGLGTDAVAKSHSAIASIPFDVFDAFPATRATSKLIRGIHDTATGGIYRAIGGVNKAIGDAFRAQAEPPPEPRSRRLPSSRGDLELEPPAQLEAPKLDTAD